MVFKLVGRKGTGFMTFYQELQLNQAGSKAVIKNASGFGEKFRHSAVYLFKILITLLFCMAFVIAYSTIFGNDNSIAGVVVLLCIMVFRFADLGIRVPHAMGAIGVIFAVLAFGPRIANAGNAVFGLATNVICIFLLMVLGCHNVMMANQSTLVLGYLLLYGYDVTGQAYLMRLAAIGTGAVLTGIVYYRNHRRQTYKRDLNSLIQEFDIHSSRTRWQLTVTLGVSSVLFFAALMHLPRAMWAGIAAMSVLLPFRKNIKERVKGRIPGNILGGVAFLLLYLILPPSYYTLIGILGGIGVGLSASYQWQAVFNSLGAMAVAVGILGLPGAIFFRILNNAFGALYGQVFEKLMCRSVDRLTGRQCLE